VTFTDQEYNRAELRGLARLLLSAALITVILYLLGIRGGTGTIPAEAPDTVIFTPP
jgi:hypothetical protein